MAIECTALSFSFDTLKVFDSFSRTFPDRHVTAVLGPSGCGKTTLLNLISGLLPFYSGSIRGTETNRISYLFQEPRLLPWMTVSRNIEIVLEPFWDGPERHRRAVHFLELVGLSGFEEYYPHQLSGGMRQRTAIARAFAYPAAILLMDEPFQALDLHRKLSLIRFFEQLWNLDPRTAIFVTHDIQEALILGDTILVLQGPPAKIARELHNPLPRFERKLKALPILEMEQELYEVLAGEEGEEPSGYGETQKEL